MQRLLQRSLSRPSKRRLASTSTLSHSDDAVHCSSATPAGGSCEYSSEQHMERIDERSLEELESCDVETPAAQLTAAQSARQGHSRSLPERFDKSVVHHFDHGDSGYGAEMMINSTDLLDDNHEDRSSATRRCSMKHHDEQCSDASITKSDQNSDVSRSHRYRSSLRKFRHRSETFLRQRLRPSCLRPDKGSDEPDCAPYGTRSLEDHRGGGGQLELEMPRRRRALYTLRRRSAFDVGSSDFPSGVKSTASSSSLGWDMNCNELNDNVSASAALTAPSRSARSSRSDLLTLPSSLDMDPWTSSDQSHQSSPSEPPSPPISLADQTKSTYQRAVSSVLNPIGCPDDRPGFSPSDLATLLRDIFQFDVEYHKAVISQVRRFKPPTNVVVKVQVVEAKELQTKDIFENCSPFCVLGIASSRSPKASPHDSPRSSPIVRRKSSKQLSLDQDDLFQTSASRLVNGAAQWNESFELESSDLQNDELHIVISNTCQQREQVRRASFKNLLRHLRLSMDAGRNNSNFLGQIRIPLKEIQAGGCDVWLPLYHGKRQRLPQSGLLRLRLKLAVKQPSVTKEFIPDDVLSDYHLAVKKVYMHALTCHAHLSNDDELFEDLPERCHFILDQFASYNCVSEFDQHFSQLAVLLEMKSDSAFGSYVSDQLLKDEVAYIKHECDELVVCHGPSALTVTELQKTILDDSFSLYLRALVIQLKHKKLLPRLFPPDQLQLEELNHLVSHALNLLCLPIWSSSHDNSQSRLDFTAFITFQLQENVRQWLLLKLETVQSAEADPVLTLIRQFVKVLRETALVLTPICSVSEYFTRLGLDYYKVASLTCDTRLSAKANELTLESDQYQVKYNRFRVNIHESSIVTLDHYFALRSLHTAIRGNVTERELFRISMSNYQTWFKGAITFWLQTFREECMRRMEKALEIDKDVVQVTCLVKYSNSVVDVLSCFAKMTSEWREIDFADADIALLGVTKITDTICDCVKLYLDKVIGILESNGYYDYIDNQQFDVTDQLCITLNNISHVREYLGELSSLLHWDIVSQQLSIKHENEAVGQTALQSLTNLVSVTSDDVTAQSRVLSQQIIQKITIDLKKYTIEFTRCRDRLPGAVDPLLDYLENNLKVLYQKLDSTIYPLFLEEILKAEMQILTEYLEVGQAPSYYERILSYMTTIGNFFHSGGVDPSTMLSCKLCLRLKQLLHVNSLTSENLALLYYKSLTKTKSVVHEYYGHLAVKVGYKAEAAGLIAIHVNVVQAQCLPGMSNNDLSCPFVSVELCPLTMFPVKGRHRTKVRTATVNPLYEEKFEFPGLAEEYRSTTGTVIIFSVWHHEALLSNAFLGEVVLPLSDLRQISSSKTVDELPVVMMPLCRPKEPRDGPYKVLKDRQLNNDKLAHVLLEQRHRTVAFHSRCRLCHPVKSIVASITGKKLEVIGRKGSICTSVARNGNARTSMSADDDSIISS